MEKRRIDSSKFNLFLANVIIDFDISMHKICRNEKNIFLYLVFFLRVQHSFTSYNKTNFRNCINNNKYLSSSLISSYSWFACRILDATIIYTFAARKTDEPSACHQPFWIFSFVLQHNRKSRSTIIESLGSFLNASNYPHLPIIQFHDRKV